MEELETLLGAAGVGAGPTLSRLGETCGGLEMGLVWSRADCVLVLLVFLSFRFCFFPPAD